MIYVCVPTTFNLWPSFNETLATYWFIHVLNISVHSEPASDQPWLCILLAIQSTTLSIIFNCHFLAIIHKSMCCHMSLTYAQA